MCSRRMRAGGSIWSKGSCKTFGGFGWREAEKADLERVGVELPDEDEGAWSPAVGRGKDGGDGEPVFMFSLLEFVDPQWPSVLGTQGS